MFIRHFHTNYVFILILTLCLALQSVYAADEEEGGAADSDATYYELAPPFVVNLQDTGKRVRFLQARIQVLAYGKKTIDVVKTHDAPIRDALITLLSSKRRSDISTTKKKKALQEEALTKVKDVLKEETGRSHVEGLYFTNFVIQ